MTWGRTVAALTMLGLLMGAEVPAARPHRAAHMAAAPAGSPHPAEQPAPSAMPMPRPGTPQYFGDWAVGCDNVLRCEIVSLQGEETSEDEPVVVQFTRAAGSGGEVALRVKSLQPLPASLVLVVDGQALATLAVAGDPDEMALSGVQALAAARAMAGAAAVELRTAPARGQRGGAATIGAVSTTGLAEALRFVDARQGRVGSIGALAAAGTQPDSAVPPPPSAPMVTQIPSPDADGAAQLSPAERAAAQALAQCDPMLAAGPVADLAPLDGQAALLLLPCEAGAYNVSAVPLVARGAAGARRFAIARFDYAPGFTGEPGKPPLVVNALWDARRGVLSSLAKGRGAGDCGASEDYVWDGARFRLIESRAMHVCRGAWEWIRLWTAVPERRGAGEGGAVAGP